MNHSLTVLIHEACHNLIFKNKTANRLAGILCDVSIVVPGAMAFRKFHMYHHRNSGHRDLDPDIPPVWEADLVGNSPLKKALWIGFFLVSQCFRPNKLKNVNLLNKWIALNFAFSAISISLIVYFFRTVGASLPRPFKLFWFGITSLWWKVDSRAFRH